MLQTFTKDQLEEIQNEKIRKLRINLQEEGIGSAMVGKRLVTVGDHDCSFNNWKEFLIAQIFDMGLNRFCEKTGWFKNELIENLANNPEDDSMWLDEAEQFFDAMEANY